MAGNIELERSLVDAVMAYNRGRIERGKANPLLLKTDVPEPGPLRLLARRYPGLRPQTTPEVVAPVQSAEQQSTVRPAPKVLILKSA